MSSTLSCSIWSLLLSLSLQLLLSPSLTFAQTSWNQVSILSASSPNCTNVATTATNCPFPTFLVLTTTTYGTLNVNSRYLVLTGTDGTEMGPFWLSRYYGDNGSNTTLQCTVMPTQYTPTLVATSASATAPLLNLTIRGGGGGGGGQAVSAASLVSFAYDAGPTLTSISGCTFTGSTSTTTSCDPATTVLTFTGSGFRWYSNPGVVQLWLGSSYITLSSGGGANQAALSVQSDTQLTVNMNTAYVYLVLPAHYGGTLIPVFFNEYRTSQGVRINQYTNQLAVSFIAQPAPIVNNVLVFVGCQGTNGTAGPFTNCIPGLSVMSILGLYMYDVTITVGGQPCVQTRTVSSTQIMCLLPNLVGVGPYDVVVSDPNSAIVVYTTDSGMISFRSGVALSAVTTCVDTGDLNQLGFWMGGLCNVNQTVTFTGNNFIVGDTTAAVVISTQGGGNNQRSVNCSSVTVLSSQSLTCVLPDGSGMYGNNVNVRAYFSSNTLISNQLTVELYNYQSAPVVTNVWGCGGGPNVYTYNCKSGASLTITGSNLFINNTAADTAVVPTATQNGANNNPNSVNYVGWGCTITSISATRVICSLPTFDSMVSPVTPDTLYPMNVAVDLPGGGNSNVMYSNVFYISFDLGTGVTSWSQVSIVSLSSTNCTQSGSALLNCPFPAQIIITTSGYSAINVGQNQGGNNNNGVWFIATAADGTEIYAQATRWVGDLGANTYLYVNVMPTLYTPSIVASSASANGPTLSVSLRAFNGGASGATVSVANLLSFAYDAGPTLTSISGCTGSGLATTACDPANAVLTFTGSGFKWYSNPGAVQMWLGTGYTAVTGQGGGPNQAALVVQSDTQMTVNLATAYTYLLLPVHYGGTLVPIFFNEQQWSWANGAYTNQYSNQLSVSFIPQPPSVVTSIQIPQRNGGYGCQGTNSTGPYTSCIPNYSYINIYGSYIYDVTVTVGGLACYATVIVSSNQLRCVLPLLPGTGPYDLVVSDPNGYVNNIWTDAGLISYQSGPTISSVTTCTDNGITNQLGFYYGGMCNDGQTITVYGANFVVGDTSVVVSITWTPGGNPNNIPSWLKSITVACTSPSVLSSTAIQCTLPYLTQQTDAAVNASMYMYDVNVAVQVTLSTGTTNTLTLVLWNAPDAPVVTSVTGCARSNSALSLSGCSSGNVLTITGSGLYNASASNPIVWVSPVTIGNTFPQWSCTITSTTATQVLCTLPTFDSQVSPVVPGTTYAMGLWYAFEQSNAFRIDFTPVSSSSSSSSGLSKAGIVAIAVLIPLFALCLICVGGYCLTKKGVKMPKMPQLDGGSSRSTSNFGKQVDDDNGPETSTTESDVEMN